MLALSDPVQMALISALCSLMTVIVSGIMALILKRMDGRVSEAKQAIVTLEKNTNSIKDELVRVTRSNALQEGETTGRDKAEAKSAASSTPAADGPIPFTGASGTIELKATVNPPKKD